jgi:hypothetical protein
MNTSSNNPDKGTMQCQEGVQETRRGRQGGGSKVGVSCDYPLCWNP